MAVRESDVESYLKQQVEAHGGMYEKFKSPQKRHVPDDLCTWPGGFMDLVECKRPKKKPIPGQVRDHKRRAKLGVWVWVTDTFERVDRYISYCKHRAENPDLFRPQSPPF